MKTAQVFILETNRMVVAAKSGNMSAAGDQLKAMGKNACGTCHKAFKSK